MNCAHVTVEKTWLKLHNDFHVETRQKNCNNATQLTYLPNSDSLAKNTTTSQLRRHKVPTWSYFRYKTTATINCCFQWQRRSTRNMTTAVSCFSNKRNQNSKRKTTKSVKWNSSCFLNYLMHNSHRHSVSFNATHQVNPS